MTASPTPPETSTEQRSALIRDLYSRYERTSGQYADALLRAVNLIKADAARIADLTAEVERLERAFANAFLAAEDNRHAADEYEDLKNEAMRAARAAEARATEAERQRDAMREALDWYAGPMTYAAIAEGEQP